MWLDKLEGMNVKRRIDNCSVSISRHYYHVGGYVAEHTPFFIGQRLLAHTDGISSRYDSIANEILMFFRSQKKLQGEVSLSETLETDKDGNSLFLMDVVGVEDTMLDDLDTRESHIRVRQLVDQCLTAREADIIRQRYGLDGKAPRTQRELAAQYGISRSYVSRIEKRALGKLEEALGGEL